MGKYTAQELVECYQKHMSSTMAARELGVSPSTICKAAHKLGVKLDGRKHHCGQRTKTGPKETTKHGTRTMYTHYGCRCPACCRAEHAQYLKRKDSKLRKRVNSKWSDPEKIVPTGSGRRESQRRHNARRYEVLGWQRITWKQIVDDYGMRCAICGCEVDPTDTWINENGRKCFGRRYPTVDHIIPLRRGGTDTRDNVQLACKHCNSSKGQQI